MLDGSDCNVDLIDIFMIDRSKCQIEEISIQFNSETKTETQIWKKNK